MIDFLKYRYMCLAGSIILLAIGVIGYVAKGGFKYHIDFVGGAEIRVSFENPVQISLLRDAINEQGWRDSVIQSVGAANKAFIIRVVVDEKSQASGKLHDVEAKFKSAMEKAFSGNKFIVENIDVVGSEAGKDVQWNAVLAVIWVLLLILIYITLRSKYGYGAGAVVSLIHDMLAVLVCILLFDYSMSLSVLTAVLAVLGYSLNDTIVIFSRIQENIKLMRGTPLDHIINVSINQTLKRTLLTSFATLLSMISLFFLGGETLRGFSFAMIIGIIVGTYSSIYIASPIVLAVGVPTEKEK